MSRPKKNNGMPYAYVEADTSFLVNDDPDLTPIRISLPSPPPLHLIDGYGLPPNEQRFKRQREPERLTLLIERIKDELNLKAKENQQFRATGFKIQQRINEELSINADRYENELKWIKKQWWHRVHGYWFYNNGKPTYICGWHFTYLNYWYSPSIKGGYPEYRDRDRRWFLFKKYIYDCTETFANLDKDGKAVKEEDGTFKMIDTGKRGFYGTINNKHRRAGETFKSLCIGHEIAILNPGTYAGLMSYTSKQVEDTFDLMLVPAWREFPLYLKPYYSSSNKPAQEIKYDVPPNEMSEKGLNVAINYSPSGDAKGYDGKKVCFLLVDESGKTTEYNINERHSVLKQCLSLGNGAKIIGFCVYPSTVEELTEEGGKEYKTMQEQSNFYHRVPATGSTITGLAVDFYSAIDGLEGYVDSHGMSVSDEPTENQKKEGFKTGAKNWLQGELDVLLKRGDPESINRYRELKRKFPIRWADSWIGNTGNIGFDILKIDKRIAEINSNKSTLMPQRGNFIGNLTDPTWMPDEENGRFYISYKPPVSQINQKIRTIEVDAITNQPKMVWKPAGVNGFVRFTAGSDSFDFLKENEAKKREDKSKTSKGGGAVFMNRDKRIDPDDKPIEQWETYRYVCTYLYRPPSDDEYIDDMIRMCVWYGAYMYPETNKKNLLKEFVKKGFGGYLSYDIDPVTGKRADAPGIYLQKQKNDVFALFQSYILHRCHIERHVELLEDAKNIPSIDRLTDYDRLAASMEALWGSRNNYNEVMSFTSTGVDLMSLSRGLRR